MQTVPAGPRAIPREEWSRKAIHVSAVVIPIGLHQMPSSVALALVAGLALLSVALEAWRFRSPAAGAWFRRRYGHLLRPHEHDRFVASTHLLLGATLATVCYGPEIAALAVGYLALGDPAAALVGMRYGTRYVGAKTLEGSLAFLAACALPALLVTTIPPFACVAGALAGATAELFAGRLDDNLTVPLASGGIVALLVS